MRRRLPLAMLVLSLATFVGACGGGGEKTTATTTAPAPTTTEAVDNTLPRLPEVFVPIAGHTYVQLPDSVLGDLQDQFASDPGSKEAVAAADGRSVTLDGEPVAFVIAVKFDDRSAAVPDIDERFISGATEDAVSKRQLSLADEDATIGTRSDGSFVIAWLKGTLALVVIGGDEAAITTVATALIAANK